MMRRLTRIEIESLVGKGKELDFALQLLEEIPPPLPPVRVSAPVVDRVNACVLRWLAGRFLGNELYKAVVAFSHLTMRYPEHPAFDEIRNDVSRNEIMSALQVISNRGTCKWFPCVAHGAGLLVIPRGDGQSSFEPLYLVTLDKNDPRLKEIGIKVLGEALRVMCTIPVDDEDIPLPRKIAIKKIVQKIWSCEHNHENVGV
jgi:hypothetical protein